MGTIFKTLPLSSVRRRVIGSFVAALVGLAALVISYYAFVMGPYENPGILVWVTVVGGAFVFATWLIFLMPLYLFLPSDSALWRWPVCTICGTLAGAVIMLLISCFSGGIRDPEGSSMILLAAITGAATCLFGSLTARFFRHGRK
jgi:hypothetical protein